MNIKEIIHNLYQCSKEPDDEVKISIPEIGEYSIAKVYQETRDTQWRSYDTVIVLEAQRDN